jgi:hypothetical protein
MEHNLEKMAMQCQNLTEQEFLQTLFNADGSLVDKTLLDRPWSTGNIKEHIDVENRIRQICQSSNSGDEFTTLALAIGKYDYYGGPCDWNPIYKKEKTIYKWCQWIIDNQNEYSESIDLILEQYYRGAIPDCFDLMINYFT